MGDERPDRGGGQPRSLLAEQIRALAERIARGAAEAQRAADERAVRLEGRLPDELRRLRKLTAERSEAQGERPAEASQRPGPGAGAEQPPEERATRAPESTESGRTVAELGEQLMTEIERFRMEATAWMADVEQQLSKRLEERFAEGERRLADAARPGPEAEATERAAEQEGPRKLSRRERRRELKLTRKERRQELKLARQERDRKLEAAVKRLNERAEAVGRELDGRRADLEEGARRTVQVAQREAEERIRASAAASRSEIESALRAEVLAEFRSVAREAEQEARRSFEHTVEAANARIESAEHAQEREERIRAGIDSLERGAMARVHEAESRLLELMGAIRAAEERLAAADERVNAAEERLRGSVVELRQRRR